MLEKLLDEKNDVTLAQLCKKLKEQTKIQISMSSMCRFCFQHNLTRKKTFRATKLEIEKIQEQQTEYWKAIREVDEKNLVFLDETGVNLALTKTYARYFTYPRLTQERYIW